jgi:uncharacterized protein YerC
MAKVLGFAIKNQWINFTLYFPNFMYKTKRNPFNNKFCDWIIPANAHDRLKSNLQPIGGKQKDTEFLGHGEHYQTDFVEINKEDFVNVFYTELFTLNNIPYLQYGMRIDKSRLKGTYKRDITGGSASPASKINQEINNGNDPTQYYFLKGVMNNDILQYLVDSKII